MYDPDKEFKLGELFFVCSTIASITVNESWKSLSVSFKVSLIDEFACPLFNLICTLDQLSVS